MGLLSVVAALLAVVGFVLMLFVPGLAIFAALMLAVGIILGIGVVLSGTADHGIDSMSDVEERRAEYERRHPRRRVR
ncbi:MAG: hypothetical protein ABI200_03120 [Gaiellales bacterium]